METENKYERLETDRLVERLRVLADHGVTSDSDLRMLRAAAKRLEQLYHDTSPSSARVSSEGTSERERQTLCQQAFISGADWMANRYNHRDDGQMIAAKARQFYPLPQITRPLRATFSDGSVWSFEPEGAPPPQSFARHSPHSTSWHQLSALSLHIVHAGDIKLLGRILSGETEPVEEVSSLPALDGRE